MTNGCFREKPRRTNSRYLLNTTRQRPFHIDSDLAPQQIRRRKYDECQGIIAKQLLLCERSCNAAVAGFEGEVYLFYTAKPNMEFTVLVICAPSPPHFPTSGVSAPRDDVLKCYNYQAKPLEKPRTFDSWTLQHRFTLKIRVQFSLVDNMSILPS